MVKFLLGIKQNVHLKMTGKSLRNFFISNNHLLQKTYVEFKHRMLKFLLILNLSKIIQQICKTKNKNKIKKIKIEIKNQILENLKTKFKFKNFKLN